MSFWSTLFNLRSGEDNKITNEKGKKTTQQQKKIKSEKSPYKLLSNYNFNEFKKIGT